MFAGVVRLRVFESNATAVSPAPDTKKSGFRERKPRPLLNKPLVWLKFLIPGTFACQPPIHLPAVENRVPASPHREPTRLISVPSLQRERMARLQTPGVRLSRCAAEPFACSLHTSSGETSQFRYYLFLESGNKGVRR